MHKVIHIVSQLSSLSILDISNNNLSGIITGKMLQLTKTLSWFDYSKTHSTSFYRYSSSSSNEPASQDSRNMDRIASLLRSTVRQSYVATGKSESECISPLLYVNTTPNVLSSIECQQLIALAEKQATGSGEGSGQGWSTDRHADYKTTDIDCRCSHLLIDTMNSQLQKIILPLIGHLFLSNIQTSTSSNNPTSSNPTSSNNTSTTAVVTKSTQPPNLSSGSRNICFSSSLPTLPLKTVPLELLEVDDVFLIKYEYDPSADPPKQNYLKVHRDDSVLSFVINLNRSGIDFENGGTHFVEHTNDKNEIVPYLVNPRNIGTLVSFCGKQRHSGYPITKGVRYVLAGFIQVNNNGSNNGSNNITTRDEHLDSVGRLMEREAERLFNV